MIKISIRSRVGKPPTFIPTSCAKSLQTRWEHLMTWSLCVRLRYNAWLTLKGNEDSGTYQEKIKVSFSSKHTIVSQLDFEQDKPFL